MGGRIRVVKESRASKHVKELYDFQCQVCGQTLVLPGGRYSEVAHLRPLGRPHNGSDDEANSVCLCPNHRVLLDLGAFGVSDDFRLIGIRLYGPLRMHPEHKISKDNLRYHREHILADQS